MFGTVLKRLVFATVAATLLVSMLGCQSTSNTSTTDNNPITIVIPEDPPNFNPILNDTGYDGLVMELVLLGLSDIDADGKVFPELAAELPTIENGGVSVDESAGTMDVTWKLRPNVKWADGLPVTAADVVFTYETIANPETGAWFPGVDYIDSVEQVDDLTVVIHYNGIYTSYLTQFGAEQMAIWPAHYCDADQGFATWDCNTKPLSNGPYILTDWQVGDHMTFERNPNYYEAGKPSIDSISVKIVPDDAVRKTMLENGDADIDMWVKEKVIDELKGNAQVKVSISATPRWVMRLHLNQAAKGTTDAAAAPHPILSDVRVRQAIRMAIDADTIAKEIFLGYDQPIWTEFFRDPYKCNIPRPKFDPEAAKTLLEEAGWKDTDGDGVRECQGCGTGAPDGYVMEMQFNTYSEFGEQMPLTQQLIAEQLSAVGIKLNIESTEGNVLWDYAESGGLEQSGNFDIDIWDDGYAGIDPTEFLAEFYSEAAATPDNGYNLGRWINPRFNELLDSVYTLDEGVRQRAFCEMAQILDDEVPQILLFSLVNADAHSARLEGVQSNSNDLITWNVADWTIK